MNALKTYYRVKREESDKAFQEELEREKEEFEFMSDEEKEEYLKIKAEKRKEIEAMLHFADVVNSMTRGEYK